MKLETVYNVKFLPLIQSFVNEMAIIYGASEKELQELELITEEAAMHIITNYPSSNDDDIFEIVCNINEEKNTLRIIMRNKGLPVDKDNIPQYKTENPDDSFDGLKFFLIEQFTDSFSFINCGQDGWNTILEKSLVKLSAIRAQEKLAIQKHTEADTTKVVISVATPDDAYEITKLAYYTYRYTYAKTVFYYPEMLKEALENGNIISIIAKDESGDIVVHGAYIRSSQSRDVAEIGALMSSPKYRRSSAIARLIKVLTDYPLHEESGLTIMDSYLVTTHTGSQRLTKLFGFTPTALKLSMHEQAEFININEGKKQQRETLLYSIWRPRNVDINAKIYVPTEHKEISKNIFESAPFTPRILCDTATELPNESKYKIIKNDKYSLASIHIESFGNNWIQIIKKSTKELQKKKFTTIHLEISAVNSLPQNIDLELTNSGYFFSGIMLSTPEKWILLYIFLNNQEFDFDKIKLLDDKAVELKDYIENCYKITEQI